MKIFREVILIFGIYYAGELISEAFCLSLPGSLIGMIMLFALLWTHVIRLEHIALVSNFLLEHMSFFFLPAGVALMAYFPLMKDLWIAMLILCLVTTVITMGCSGWVIQHMMERKRSS